MPVLQPSGGESQDDFIGRCVSSLQGEFDDQEQRLAVCFDAWRDRQMKNYKDRFAFEESKHPRGEEGTSKGGQFVPKEGDGGTEPRKERVGELRSIRSIGSIRDALSEIRSKMRDAVRAGDDESVATELQALTALKKALLKTRGSEEAKIEIEEDMNDLRKNVSSRRGVKEHFQRDGSHRIEQRDGMVVIRDLELFVGFDKELDGEKSKLRRFDRRGVEAIVSRTKEYIARGQTPKLILGHNDKDTSKPNDRPVIGDIPRIKLRDIGGVTGIVGDVEVTQEVFDSFLKTNTYPRRSAEIWPDGFLSEVALLGAQTPARPLPDTKFARPPGVEVFSRDMEAVQFALPSPTMTEPSAASVVIPAGVEPKRKPSPPRSAKMADKNDDVKDTDQDDEKDKLKAQLREKDEEIEKLKKRMSRSELDEDEKDRQMRVTTIERDDFSRRIERDGERIAALELDVRTERFGRKLDVMLGEGYRMAPKQHDDILQRVVRAENPDAELEFIKSMMHRDPVNVQIDQSGLRTGGTTGARQQLEKEGKAAEKARDRCVDEGKHDQFSKFYEEELAASA